MKIVIVTALFPPSQFANALRPFLLAREMLSSGHSVEVITSYTTSLPNSKKINCHGKSGIVVHYIDDIMLAFQRKPLVWKIFNPLLKRLWPDSKLLWVFQAARSLRKINGEVKVVVCINPVSALLFPWLVRSKRFRFVFDYLESVTPFRTQVPFEMFPHRQLVGLLSRIEKITLSKSDTIVFTCEENRLSYISDGLCYANKTIYIPHYCDPNPYVFGQIPSEGKLVISYVGFFNRDRSPFSFLSGLRLLLDRKPDSTNSLCVNLYGNGLGEYSYLIKDLCLEGLVKDCGMVDYDEGRQINANSHVLLLVTSPVHKLFYPSKIAEYIAARRPILALMPPDSEVAVLLRRSEREEWLCDYDDPVTVANCLYNIWEKFEEGKLSTLLPEYEEALTAHYTPIWEQVLS